MKNRLHVLLIVLAIVSCFGGYYYWYNHSTETTISVVTESKDKLSTTRLFELHNNIRKKHKLKSFTWNDQLAKAAELKVQDIVTNNYFAHESPSGLTPWYWIRKSGYTYIHAGENLARDFSNPNDIVVAWMASPTHRRNILDGRYKDIGIAVVDGYINGVETTLVVQMFGVRQSAAAEVASGNVVSQVYAQEIPKVYPATTISPFDAKKSWSIALVTIIILALALDWFFVWKNNIIRISGKTWAHLTYFLTLAVILFIIRQGLVL